MVQEKKIGRTAVFLVLCLGVVPVVTPFVWMILSSFKEVAEFYVFPPKVLPRKPSLDNFRELFSRGDFGRYYANSLLVTAVQVLFDVVIVTMAGYGFAKYRFRGREFFFTVVLSTSMVPWIATIIPLFLMATSVRANDTWFGLIFPGLADVFSIFLARNFLTSIPTELIESGRMDGAGEFEMFVKLALPLAKPLIAVITIGKFIGSWNAFQWPLLIVGRDELRTLPLAVAKFSSQYNDAYNLKMAAAALASVPVLVVYVAFQKYFVAGISLSGIKG